MRHDKVQQAIMYFEGNPSALQAPGALTRALNMLRRPDSIGLTEEEITEVLNKLDIPFGMGRLVEGDRE